MANQKNLNVVMHGVSGLVGKLIVFRHRQNGKVIIADRAKKSTKLVSPERLLARERFADAAAYAKTAILDPVLRQAYLDKAIVGQSAYNIAFSDFMQLPKLKKAITDSYTGSIGDAISLQITDVLEVKKVVVTLKAADDSVIETGEAVLQSNNSEWKYIATVENQNVTGTSLVVEMTDTPGNTAVVTVEL